VILAGEPGLGKSWLALDMFFRLSLGHPWATKDNAAGPQRVLYLDEENNFRLVRHRMSKRVSGMDLSSTALDPAFLAASYAMEQGINLDDPASLDLLKRKLDQLRPQWIILDSLVRIHRRDENSNAEMSALIGGIIKPLARNVGAGAIVIHHLGKATKDRPDSRVRERIRGASDIVACADQVWGLERADDALLLSHIKCRYDRESLPITVTLEDIQAASGIRITYEAEDLDSGRVVLEAVQLAGQDGTDPSSLTRLLEDRGFKQAKRLVTRHLGLLHQKGQAKKKKVGRTVRYWLTDYAPPLSE
jgi:hypothetical protein